MMKSIAKISIETAQQGLAFAAILTILFGAAFALNGQTAPATMNFGVSLYFVFACNNPELLLKKLHQLDTRVVELEETKFLFASLALILLSVGWELFVLPV